MSLQQISAKTMGVFKSFPTQFDKRDLLIHLMECVGELSEAMLIVEKRKKTNRPDKQRTVKDVSRRLCDVMTYVLVLADRYEIDLDADMGSLLDKMQARIDGGEFDKK
jgi:NTP pyrophosphatase (non-canonical NTP hydrolase)